MVESILRASFQAIFWTFQSCFDGEGLEQDSLLRYLTETEEILLSAGREDGSLKARKREKEQKVQRGHEEALLNEGLHNQFPSEVVGTG